METGRDAEAELSDLLNFSQYAKRKGWTQPYVSQLVKQGVIPLAEGKKIDPDVADAAVAAHRDPSKQYTADRHAANRSFGPGAHPAVESHSPFQRARAVRETFAAKQAQIDYERSIGKLIRVEDFEHAYADKLAAARDELLTLSDRLAARVAASSDRAECWRIIDEGVRLAMRHLATHQSPKGPM